MTEYESALAFAREVGRHPTPQPENDLVKLARQFLLAVEREAQNSKIIAGLTAKVADARAEVEQLRKELSMWKPLSRDEAEQAFRDAKAVPLSEERIQEIVKRATDPAERIPNSEQAQLAMRIKALQAALLAFGKAARATVLLDYADTLPHLPNDALTAIAVPVSAWRRAAELTGV